MKTVWIDEHHVDGEKVYETRDEALKVIKDILKSDYDLLDGRNMADISEDKIFEIGHKWYGIFESEVESPPCCDDQDLEFDMDGYTDGTEVETWKCNSCNQSYRVPIQIVRDFDNMEPTKKPWSKLDAFGMD